MGELPTLADFPGRTFDKLRFGDTDSVGHVNNAVFSTLFETGRVTLLYQDNPVPVEDGFGFVLAHISIDFIGEILWPGQVDIGTGIARIGRSSVQFTQALFQNGQCVARATSTIVLTNRTTRRSHPMPETILASLRSKTVSDATFC
ncbi:acyl-CoA thioesterase [Mariluticola halotolerans]|uniref:acyl-CoA thioesterase n=1 Tax=Mariluticola halotolerans TaxID=2909283 RepID=UPI0026E23565|nr:thioesterase family protein [Mariluticola halotolerans]UJQ94013.1 acyl-CoA thioesterase [Mariluticola halotolerans]